VYQSLLYAAAAMQALAVVYGLILLRRRRGAAGAWLWLLGAMLSMLTWRVAVVGEMEPSPFFTYTIAIWGSTCMLLAMFFFGREVARRERAERERDALLQSERAARADAERSSQLKDQFLATLSHELRTPLAAILGWCNVLKIQREQPASSEEAQIGSIVDAIERNARLQARLVDDLLDMTRIQAGSLRLETERVALDVPVRAAIESLGPSLDEKSIRLSFACEGEPPVVVGDGGRLQQIAANLIGNAVKFTAAGGTIDVSIDRDGGLARLVVVDDGEGIEPAFLPHLFTRFRQGDATTARRHGGLGLGLSIVANLVELHGGQVEATSEGKGTGASFTVRLPLAAQADDSPRVDESAPTTTVRGMRVLLIEDQSDVRTAVAQLLERHGADVLALESGAQLEAALTSHQPHVLVSDIGMPGEDGYALMRRLRGLPAAKGGRIPAIALTAHARGEDRGRAIASGFQAHLAKPVDPIQLLATIRRLGAPAAVDAAGE
jgi:signal transduction histidine kinase/ActR/RegA family two-component response regulator